MSIVSAEIEVGNKQSWDCTSPDWPEVGCRVLLHCITGKPGSSPTDTAGLMWITEEAFSWREKKQIWVNYTSRMREHWCRKQQNERVVWSVQDLKRGGDIPCIAKSGFIGKKNRNHLRVKESLKLCSYICPIKSLSPQRFQIAFSKKSVDFEFPL